MHFHPQLQFDTKKGHLTDFPAIVYKCSHAIEPDQSSAHEEFLNYVFSQGEANGGINW